MTISRSPSQQNIFKAIRNQDLAEAKACLNADMLGGDSRFSHPIHGSALNYALKTKFSSFIILLWSRIKEMGPEAIAANLSSRNISRQSCFHHAVELGNIKLLKEFLKHAEPGDIFLRDENCNTPLHVAARLLSKKAILTLLRYAPNKKIELNKLNTNHETPLHVACNSNDFQFNANLIAYMMEQGADISLPDIKKMTPLHYIIEDVYEYDVFIALKKLDLIAREARIEARTSTGSQMTYIGSESGLVDLFLYHYRQYVLLHRNDEAIVSSYLSLVERHNIAAYILSLMELRPTAEMEPIFKDHIFSKSDDSTTIDPLALKHFNYELKIQTSLYGELTIDSHTLVAMSDISSDIMIISEADETPKINIQAINDLKKTTNIPVMFLGDFIDLGEMLYRISSKESLTPAAHLCRDVGKLFELITDLDNYIDDLNQQEIQKPSWWRCENIFLLVLATSYAATLIGLGVDYAVTTKKIKTLDCHFSSVDECSKLKEYTYQKDTELFLFGFVGLVAVSFLFILLKYCTSCTNNSPPRKSRDKWQYLIDEEFQDNILTPLQDLEQRDGLENPAQTYLPITQANLRNLEAHLVALTSNTLPIYQLITTLTLLNNDLKELRQRMLELSKPFSLFHKPKAQDSVKIMIEPLFDDVADSETPLLSEAQPSYSW